MSDQQKDPRNFGRRPEPRPVSHTSGERNFGKPAGERKPGERAFARPAAPRRQAPHGDGLAARRVAFRVLHEVAENGAYAALALDRELTRSGMTILIVTHEMGFAREISDRVLFICDGVIKEEGTPEQIFTCPHEPSTIKFLSMVL